MSEYIHKRHNVNILLYHLVCSAKYRKAVFTNKVENELKKICDEISERYEIKFIKIGVDVDHVHFLIQSVPMYSPKKIVQTIKSITEIEIFRRCPKVKYQLWGGEFWSKGYYISTVGRHGNEEIIQNYVKEQGQQENYR
ncbi:MAG: IS200/IS605 family transposase [Bacteroidetes bacterium]|nr:MAG: IS200/IS605 family transposase [Bacteroidota bacterium]